MFKKIAQLILQAEHNFDWIQAYIQKDKTVIYEDHWSGADGHIWYLPQYDYSWWEEPFFGGKDWRG